MRSEPGRVLDVVLLRSGADRRYDQAIRQPLRKCAASREEPTALSGQDTNDVVLIKRLCAGDEEALGLLYDRYVQLVYSLAKRIVRDAATAEEVTQEVFVRLWQSASSFDPQRGQVHWWLLRISRNLALNEIRRRRSRPVAADDTMLKRMQLTLADSDPWSDPATALSLSEHTAIVRKALMHLPVQQRDPIELAFYDGLTQVEIAAELHEQLGTIKARMRAGMQRLGDELRENGIGENSID